MTWSCIAIKKPSVSAKKSAFVSHIIIIIIIIIISGHLFCHFLSLLQFAVSMRPHILVKCVGLILSFSTPYLKTVVENISVAHRHLSYVTDILLIAHKTAAGGTEEGFKQNWNVSTAITKIRCFIQTHLLRVTLVHADGQIEMDMMKVVVTFCNFANVPNNDDDDNNNNNNSNRVEGKCGHGAMVLVASVILSLAIELHISRYYGLFSHL